MSVAEPHGASGEEERAPEDPEEDLAAATAAAPGTKPRDVEFLRRSAASSGVVRRASGLQYRVVESGPSRAPSPGPSTWCRCHARGILTDGTEFDSTHQGRSPMLLRPEDTVPGLREALSLMREGDRWEIILPCHLGYGQEGAGPVPGGAALIYDLHLLEVCGMKAEVSGGLLDSEAGSFRGWAIGLAVLLGLLVLGYQQYFLRKSAAEYGPELGLHEAARPGNTRVFLDVQIGGRRGGRIEFQLFDSVGPRTAENFRALCTGERGVGRSGKPLHFKGSRFHRIVPGFALQAGDLTLGNGHGGESIYGPLFHDEWERGWVRHSEPFLLSMANRGRDTQSSQFFVTLQAEPMLDGRHVCFGRVVQGTHVVKMIEAAGTRSGDPAEEVVIVDSGQLGPHGQLIQEPIRLDDEMTGPRGYEL